MARREDRTKRHAAAEGGAAGRSRRPAKRRSRAARGGSVHHGLIETAEIDVLALREEVRRALRHVLPQMLEEELEAYLAALLRSA